LPSISKNLPPYLFHPLFQKLPEKKSTQTIFVMTKVYFCNRYFLPNRRLQKKIKNTTKRKYQQNILKRGRRKKDKNIVSPITLIY